MDISNNVFNIEQKLTYKCVNCGHSWNSRKKARPKLCPKCKVKYWEAARFCIFKEYNRMGVPVSRTSAYYSLFVCNHFKEYLPEMEQQVREDKISMSKAYFEIRRRMKLMDEYGMTISELLEVI